jgi:plastocyanin
MADRPGDFVDLNNSQLDILQDKARNLKRLLGLEYQEASGATDAITIKNGYVAITKVGVNAMTLAAPTTEVEDGFTITFLAETASAHTITTPAGKIDGSHSIVTLGGAVGDSVALTARNGKWWATSKINATVS